MTLEDVKDMLTGLPAPKIKFQFDAGDPYIGEQTVTTAPVPPWQWPEELAGLLWIENQLPFRLAACVNRSARRPMPRALLPTARVTTRRPQSLLVSDSHGDLDANQIHRGH